MPRPPQDVTDAELDILRVLWANSPRSIRAIAEQLQPDRVDGYYSTVKKLVERLERKGFVARQADGVAYLYTPLVARDELIDRRLRVLADSLCSGSPAPLLTQLAQHESLTTDQQKALLDLIAKLDQANSRTTPRKRKGSR